MCFYEKQVFLGGAHSILLLPDTISKLVFVSQEKFDLNCVINEQFTSMFVSFSITTFNDIITIIIIHFHFH
jgi:hypothetical protein